MASMVVVHHKQPSSTSTLLSSSLSDINGARLTASVQYKRKSWQPKGALRVTASSTKKILIMGGTRFIGIFLSRLLVKEGHQVTLFTRGKAPIAQQLPGESEADFADFSSKILHLKGDRKDFDFVKSSLAAEGFDVVYDINVDPKSRHKGKLETESLLQSRGVNWTSIRPVYIYGPLNYNPVEEWFFHRLKAGRPIPIPNSGIQITQLGHVKDLATAFIKVLGNEKASREVFNISGEKYVTFDGLAKACAKAAGFPEPEIVHYNPKEFDFGKKKPFPFRDQHFFASVEKAKSVLGWKPEFDLVEGLADSYNLDFGRGTFRKEADFSTDDIILGKSLVLQS
ncbi:UNVERIFIED_CONTAM: Chloroplast stem-loop binding protein of b, chloroplastic [Sesamum radiatum]|uniref:Chloroplast stem-loop binding protein of b, chloroplastic n=1 Tax=Sesamum radiatum TaxID=300843 RepID=A0AAW2UBD2_SESRA